MRRSTLVAVHEERASISSAPLRRGVKYRFDPVDVGELFTPLPDQAPGSSAIN
jgi:hypothetical protein